jgi:hypothetical protein
LNSGRPENKKNKKGKHMKYCVGCGQKKRIRWIEGFCSIRCAANLALILTHNGDGLHCPDCGGDFEDHEEDCPEVIGRHEAHSDEEFDPDCRDCWRILHEEGCETLDEYSLLHPEKLLMGGWIQTERGKEGV